jgi:hypothetical protein
MPSGTACAKVVAAQERVARRMEVTRIVRRPGVVAGMWLLSTLSIRMLVL